MTGAFWWSNLTVELGNRKGIDRVRDKFPSTLSEMHHLHSAYYLPLPYYNP
jgi:hypothetical protein